MDSIYSRIIWQELGLKDYKIHEQNVEKSDKLILDWVKDTPKEKVGEVLSDLSSINDVTDAGWYDGQFYGINQRDEDERPVDENDLIIHSTGLIPSIIDISMKCNVHPDELRLIADIIETYNKK